MGPETVKLAWRPFVAVDSAGNRNLLSAISRRPPLGTLDGNAESTPKGRLVTLAVHEDEPGGELPIQHELVELFVQGLEITRWHGSAELIPLEGVVVAVDSHGREQAQHQLRRQ
jgi:hypothetical protein